MPTVESIGPQITPLTLFAALAPACPDSFTWSNPEPEPARQHARDAFDTFDTEAHATWLAWSRRDEYGRQVAWRWFYASLMLHAMPANEQAPTVMRDPPPSPLIHGALEAFAIERARQVHEKGYHPEHDDTHTAGELAAAAAWYAVPSQTVVELPDGTMGRLWPKGWGLPEPSARNQRKRELEKAGALLAAEWERLDRLERAL